MPWPTTMHRRRTTTLPDDPTAIVAALAVQLRRARRILALCHIDPDGDAIGSLLGLGWLLRALPRPPTVMLACADPVPAALAHLPGATDITTTPPAGPWDLVVALDASDPARLGAIFQPEAFAPAPVAVIDHHITNLYFGDLNCIDPASAATAQIVTQLADALHVAIGQEAAVCLLTGIVTDTLSFRTTNTTPAVLATAARLAAAGANIAEITDRALNRRPLNVMRLWGLALNRLRLEGGVIWTEITPTMRATAGVGDDENGSLVSYLITANEACVAAVFNERTDGQVEINLRARQGYDVAQIALQLGGGGHPQAAGCTVPGPLPDAQARILPLLLSAARPCADRGVGR